MKDPISTNESFESLFYILCLLCGSQGAGPTQVFRVQIPFEVRPGQEFQVIAGARTVRVRCPAESRGGQYLQIVSPIEILMVLLQS